MVRNINKNERGNKMNKLTIEELKELAFELNYLTDKEKLRNLEALSIRKVPYKILIDNDDVYVKLGEDGDDESIGFSFDDFGYELLLTMFKYYDFDAELV